MFESLVIFFKQLLLNTGGFFPLLLMIFCFFLGITMLIVGYLLRRFYQKHLEQQLTLCEIKHSMRLIETFYSVRREYHNLLQVMKLILAVGGTKELDNYLSKTILLTINNSALNQISDPILAATVISKQAKAKDHDLSIKINCSTSLTAIADISVDLGKIIDTVLDLMIRSLIKEKNLGKTIVFNIEEGVNDYSFEFKLNDDALTAFLSIFPPEKMLTVISIDAHLPQMTEMKKIIHEINGELYYVIAGNNLLRLKLIVNKRDRDRLLQSKKVSSF